MASILMASPPICRTCVSVDCTNRVIKNSPKNHMTGSIARAKTTIMIMLLR